jgi:hypothetical protein
MKQLLLFASAASISKPPQHPFDVDDNVETSEDT